MITGLGDVHINYKKLIHYYRSLTLKKEQACIILGVSEGAVLRSLKITHLIVQNHIPGIICRAYVSHIST